MQEQRQHPFIESRVEEIIVSVVSPVCNISLLVDDEVTPPFCAYEVTSNIPEYTKDGISGWQSEASIYYVHPVEQVATANKRAILKALAAYNSNTSYIHINDIVETFDNGFFAWNIGIQVVEKI